MSCSLGVIFPKYRSSSVSLMCAASFATTHNTTENRNSQGCGAELSNCYHFAATISAVFIVYGIAIPASQQTLSGRKGLYCFMRRNF